MGDMVEFRSNGSTCPGYLATPDGGTGPGVLVIQEWWGLVPHIKDVCDRFAAEGFVALAPDLYHGASSTEPDEAGKLMMGLNLEQAAKDLSGAVDLLQERSGKPGIGVIGFCMGGGLALVVACQRPDAVKAAAPFYGLIPWPAAQPDWSRLEAKVVGHYAGLDGYFSPDMARDLEGTLPRPRQGRRDRCTRGRGPCLLQRRSRRRLPRPGRPGRVGQHAGPVPLHPLTL